MLKIAHLCYLFVILAIIATKMDGGAFLLKQLLIGI